MKKLVFIALAVVAFSGAAMAKTGEVKEDVVLSNEYKVMQTLVLNDTDPCQELAMEMTDEVSFTDDVLIHDYYQSWLDLCYSFNG